MPFHSQSTPESLLPRSDSKNPATTCKGITSNGRPCRRSLAQSPQGPPAAPRTNGQGVLAVVRNVNGDGAGAAAFYCWQHKDQANALQGTADGDTEIVNLQKRTSTDSLAARLGVFTIEEGDEPVKKKSKKRRGSSRPVRRETLPQTWQNVSGPLISVAHDGKPSHASPGRSAQRPRHRKKGDLHVSFFCCMSHNDVDDDPPLAPRPAPVRTNPPAKPTSVSRPNAATAPQPSTPQRPVPTTPNLSPIPSPSAPYPSQGPNIGHSAHTQALLSFIPSSTDPATTKLLLAELSKPLTPSDKEPGYIYIFWLTPSGGPQPAASDASTLLAPPSSRPAQGSRQASDILRTYSVKGSSSPAGAGTGTGPGAGQETRHLMLKIGRASNVTRRMTEWSRQCGHHITLLRYYPRPGPGHGQQASPSPSPLPSPTSYRRDSSTALGPQQVPLVARVERLIHVALQAQRVMRACDGCGKTHREWFEVEATREGVRRVDKVVRRWVEWGVEEGRGL